MFVEAIGGTDVDIKSKKSVEELTTKKLSTVTKKVYIDGEWSDCQFFPIENLRKTQKL